MEDDESEGLHIERIYKNEIFWLECISKAEQFFKTCLLPEILGKYYTRSNSNLTQVTDNEQPSISGTEKLSICSNSNETINPFTAVAAIWRLEVITHAAICLTLADKYF